MQCQNIFYCLIKAIRILVDDGTPYLKRSEQNTLQAMIQ